VIKYANQFPSEKKEKVLAQLAPFIRFDSMRLEFLVESVEPKYGNIPEIHEQLYNSFKFHAQPNKKYATARNYDRYYFCFNKATAGPQITLSNREMSVSTNLAWNQVQTTQEILPGSFIDFKIDDMCPPATNSYGIVIGVGPDSFARSGGGAIIGYQNQHGCGWVGNGEFFPTQVGTCGQTFTTGDTIRIKYEGDSFVWEKNGQFIKKVAKSGFFYPPNDNKYYPTIAIAQGTVSIVADPR